jgi:RteC protein
MMINSFDIFCSNIGHTSFMEFETIRLRRDDVLSKVSKLKELEGTYLFESIIDEIGYYKNERPKLIQYGIYYERLLNLETEKPIGKERKYYKELESSLYNDSLSMMEELKYYRLGSSEKDNIWVIKKSEKCDIFAVIKALMMLKKYLDNKLDSRPIEEKIADIKRLKWTGTQAEYVEELLSWKETKVINDGDVTLIELHEKFQLVFEVHITDFNGTSHDIINRLEPAKFCYKKAKALQEKKKRLQNKL